MGINNFLSNVLKETKHSKGANNFDYTHTIINGTVFDAFNKSIGQITNLTLNFNKSKFLTVIPCSFTPSTGTPLYIDFTSFIYKVNNTMLNASNDSKINFIFDQINIIILNLRSITIEAVSYTHLTLPTKRIV